MGRWHSITGIVVLWLLCSTGVGAAGEADQLVAACARTMMLGPRQALAGSVEYELGYVDPSRAGTAVVLERVGPAPTRTETLSVRYDTTYVSLPDSIADPGDSLARAAARVPVVTVHATTEEVPIPQAPLDLSAAPTETPSR